MTVTAAVLRELHRLHRQLADLRERHERGPKQIRAHEANVKKMEEEAARVKGESMIEDGIFDGDYLFVRKASSASAGDIVVALIEDEATVKRYYPEGDRVRFQPANASMEPIYVSKGQFKSTMILGHVIGVYRQVRTSRA